MIEMYLLLFYFTFANGMRYHKFAEYERAAKNETREVIVKNTLKNAAGVYMDKRNDSLSKTVMITVAAFNEVGNSFYKVYFKNFICFAKHYNYDMVVYILHHDIPNLEREMDSIRRLGVRVLTYPDELFWNIVATKKSLIIRGILLYCSILRFKYQLSHLFVRKCRLQWEGSILSVLWRFSYACPSVGSNDARIQCDLL